MSGIALLVATASASAEAGAQQEPPLEQEEQGVDEALPLRPSNSRPNVFFDCDGPRCDFEYYRSEIGWVNWVRDAEVADVHIIMTSLTTGGGGREFRLDFLGHAAWEGYEDVVLFRALSTDTDREALDGIAHTLGIGLASFANTAGYRGIVALEGPDPEASLPGQRIVSQEEVDDPWNLWVFRINGSGNLDGESTRETVRMNGSLRASRITPTWKIGLNGNVNLNRVEFDLDDGTFVDRRTDWGFNQLAVYALAAHWSVGIHTQVARMTRVNQNFRLEASPVIEYSYFPYDEATRRALTASYRIGPAYRDYIATTVFGETAETRFEHSAEIEFSQRQTWGDASITLRGSQFLHDLERSNVSLRGDVDFRIVRGLSINARGDVAWVDDQIYLAAGDVTDEEALLQLRQRATSYNYGLRLGFSVQFGSIFNNVVNNRFRGVQGFGRF